MSSKRKGGGRKERDNKKEISEGTKRGRKVDGEEGSLTRSEDDLDEKEKKARMDIEVADEP